MRPPLDRRTFLATSAALPLGLSSAIGLGRPHPPPGVSGSPADVAKLKPSLNAFSFLEQLETNAKDATKGIDLFGACDDEPYADIALAAPYTVNGQVKETTRSRLDSPRLDMKFVGVVRRTGYRGYLPIETLRMGRADDDSFVEMPRLLERLRAAIAETA